MTTYVTRQRIEMLQAAVPSYLRSDNPAKPQISAIGLGPGGNLSFTSRQRISALQAAVPMYLRRGGTDQASPAAPKYPGTRVRALRDAVPDHLRRHEE